MLFQLQRYYLNVVYKLGKEFLIVDIFSCVYFFNEFVLEKNNCDVFVV